MKDIGMIITLFVLAVLTFAWCDFIWRKYQKKDKYKNYWLMAILFSIFCLSLYIQFFFVFVLYLLKKLFSKKKIESVVVEVEKK